MSYFASGWCESRMQLFMDEHGQETSGKVFKDEQGALFYTVLPFFISRLNLLFCAGF